MICFGVFMMNKDWKTIESQTVHSNPWFKVTRDQVVTNFDKQKVFYVIRKSPASFVVPISVSGEIYLIKQFRYATRTWGWELPAGSTDFEDPLEAAKRELQEETGLKANEWEKVGTIHLTPGVSNNITHMYIAKDLVQTSYNTQKEEGIVDVKRFSLTEIKQMIKSGDILDAPTIAILARAFWA